MSRRLVPSCLLALVLGCRPTASDLPAVAPEQPSAQGVEPIESVREPFTGAAWVRRHYAKREVRIPMRDGVTLFTAIYTPLDRTGEAPILIERTPYAADPYGEDQFPSRLGPSDALMERGWIFVEQDVRGCFMSEGEFVNMRPHLEDKQAGQIDESTDAFDTIEWLLANVEGHNGRVGMVGTSYPGFYAAAGMIDAHPALRAVSPQAPIADWYFDDFHHHGAFFLPHSFNFFAVFGRKHEGLKKEWGERFDHGTPDGYEFFLRVGSLANLEARYLHGEVPFWTEATAHPDYDRFWQARNLLPHLRNVAPAVMTVGGWFDAEDLYGPLQIYRAIEAQDPEAWNVLVMGPWSHGGWHRTEGDHLGSVDFEGEHSRFFQEEIETTFFVHELEGDAGGHPDLPEAYVFETGANRWRRFEQWPPAGSPRTLWMGAGGRLVDAAPTERKAYDEYVSDPAKPVPYTEAVVTGMTKEYMSDDQRFASRRPDVLSWVGEPLTEALTVAGPITAELWVSTSQRDADWVVKLVDVFPDDAPDHRFLPEGKHMGGYQMMVRSEVIRGRYREGYDAPEPFTPGQPTRVRLPLQDVLHTFEPGHRVMIQVQSTWFPLVDRNPQKWVDNIFAAKDEDFVKATHRVYRDGGHGSRVQVTVLPPSPQ
ncbi:MAG: CocE/NonD family hydrolase [Myxococcales bacterium]|nr:CocE/NonD family hydrolase [Myxococcales bacterium]MCB9715414.1 CocE/NonD family hydrolase [Myxococcales bacterium]